MLSGEAIVPTACRLRAGTREISEVLGRLHQAIDEPLNAGDVAGVVTDLDRIVRRVQALKLKVLAGESARAAAEQAGFCDEGAWLAKQTRTTGDDAARQVRLAEQLTGATRTGEALTAGDISDRHAAVVTGALDKLPRHLGPAERDKVEQHLVEQARRLDPARLRKAARRALEAVEPDPTVVDAHENQLLQSEEDRAWAKASLSFHDNGDGTTTMHAVVPTLAGDIARKIVDTLVAPRRAGAGEQSCDWAHRRGVAFAELLEHLPTDHLHSKTAATVVVHLRHDVLMGALAAAGVDTDRPISAAAARRLACSSALIPAVFGRESLPLDLGRQARCHTDAQRVALSARHTHCSVEGCTIPFAWCEIHHRTPWSKGGPTDLANAVPLCGFHHRQVHRDDPKAWTGPPRAGRLTKDKTKPLRIPQQRRVPART